jgi:hypothetical protein
MITQIAGNGRNIPLLFTNCDTLDRCDHIPTIGSTKIYDFVGQNIIIPDHVKDHVTVEPHYRFSYRIAENCYYRIRLVALKNRNR